jgi:hypothetical protein
MITAKEAFDTIKKNCEIEAVAVLEEIDEHIKEVINVVNDPIYCICWDVLKGAYPIVEKTLIEFGYTVTITDEKGENVRIKIGWENPA